MPWMTHKNAEGREYYHNTDTNETSWTKPQELMAPGEDRALAAGSSNWQEFTTSAGKKYYYNSVTKQTTWTIPDELKPATDKAGGGAAAAAAAAAVAAEKAAAEKAAAEKAAAEKAATEALAADKQQFIQMLESAGVTELMTWEEAMRLVINNPTYRVIKTLSERKSTFEGWRDTRREVVEEAKRKEQRQRKIDFVTMLKGCAELTSRTRFRAVVGLFEQDPRWAALDDELEREELFEEYALSLERKEQQERRNKRKERLAAFRELLVASGVGVRSQWRRVQHQVEADPAYLALDKIDRLAVFEELVRELEAADEQERHAAKEATRRRERKQRDAFRALLLRMQREGTLSPKSRWEDILPHVKLTDEYRGAAEQSGSTPAELFEDVVEAVDAEYSAHRRRIKASLGSCGFEIEISTTLEQLDAALRAADEEEGAIPSISGGGSGAAQQPQWAVRFYLQEMVERLAAKSGSPGGDGSEGGRKKRKKRHRSERSDHGSESESDDERRREKKKDKKSHRHRHRSHSEKEEGEEREERRDSDAAAPSPGGAPPPPVAES